MEALKFFDKHYRLCLGIAIGIILISIGVIIAVPIMRENEKPTVLEISVAPTSASIIIDGKEYRNGTYNFEPGSYVASISQDDFDSKEVSFDVQMHAQNRLVAYITHKTEGLAHFERNAADMKLIRLSYDSDEKVRTFIDKYDQKTKISEILPIDASYNLNEGNPNLGNYMITIKISDGSNHGKCRHAFCLLVTGDRKNEQRVKEMLKINGYNYDDYEVIYE